MMRIKLIFALIILTSAISAQDYTPGHQGKYLLPEYAYGDFSLLRFRYSYEYGNYQSIGYEGEQVSIAGGIQVNKYFNRFYISPYAEVDIGYTDHIPRFNIGIYCGYYFYGK